MYVHVLFNQEAIALANSPLTGPYSMGGYKTLRIPSSLVNKKGIASLLRAILKMYNIREPKNEIDIYSEGLMTQLNDTKGFAAFYVDHPQLKDVRFALKLTDSPQLIIRPLHISLADFFQDNENSQRYAISQSVSAEAQLHLANL